MGSALAQETPPAPSKMEKKPQFQWQFHALPLANLVYQLDCLSGQGHCSLEAYRELWQSQLQWNASDQAHIKQWQALKARYQMQWLFESSTNLTSHFPLRFEGLDLTRKFRLPALEARDLADYQSRVALLLHPKDSEQITDLLAHFYPRFEIWWQTQAEAKTERAAKEFLQIMQAHQLADLAENSAQFYASQLPAGGVLNFHFFFRPGGLGSNGNQNGEQIENHSLIEVIPEKPLQNQVAVILHELNHYFYSRSEPSKHATLVGWFASRPEPWAIPAYNLLNEVVATSLANGLVMRKVLSPASYTRYFQTPGSFYFDAFIDPVAKALMPRLELALKQKETLYSPFFLSDYLSTVKNALGDKALAPELFLRTSGLVSEGQELQPVVKAFQQELRVGTSWGSQNLSQGYKTFQHFQALSGAVFLKPSQIPQLESWAPLLNLAEFKKINKQSQLKKPFIWGLQRQPSTWLYFFVAETPSEFQLLIQRFKTQKQVFAGPL
ncbi:MAG: hypothetical protein IV090_18670 [Candidatus Sericytochromatia bacterium]|nr:hypothetical protein [Candidatus Sericytochromatia bacterium]